MDYLCVVGVVVLVAIYLINRWRPSVGGPPLPVETSKTPSHQHSSSLVQCPRCRGLFLVITALQSITCPHCGRDIVVLSLE